VERRARHVVHAPVGDEDRARDALVRHVGERGGECAEQSRAVGLAIGLAGLDEAHLHVRQPSEPLGDLRARGLGLCRAVAELLAWALVDHHDRDRGQGVAIFARERGIGEREHEQRERDHAHQGAAAAAEYDQKRDQERDAGRGPQDVSGNQRRE
jgi:hypothetical protein